MRLADITHGEEHRATVHFAPNIAEQMELASRMNLLATALADAAITPTLKTREFKGYLSNQPSGKARVSASYSKEKDGRFSAEVEATHRPSGLKSLYILSHDDGSFWSRTERSPRGLIEGYVSHDDMVRDMLEYAPADGAMAELIDRVAAAESIVAALFSDMNRSSSYRAGSDHYRSILPYVSQDGYAAAKHIELVDGRVHNKTKRRLSVAALINIGSGPVDIFQTLSYEVTHGKKKEIIEEDISLTLTSRDGLSPHALARYAEGSDTGERRIDLLHDALDDLSRNVFLEQ